jgi:nitrate reductase NapAB chaperone NapD
MPNNARACISGLLITLLGEHDAATTIARIAAVPGIIFGPRNGAALPVALESADNHAAEQTFQRLRDLPGVGSVDVVYVQWFS